MSYTVIKDYEDIFALLQQYAEGCNESGEAAKKTFHTNALVNGDPAEGFFKAVDKAGKTEATARIDILDVAGNVACARVVMENWHGMNFVDFHQLMKVDNEWKIVSKVYKAYKN